MAKKRKTRKEKERLQQRKSTVRTTSPEPSVTEKKAPVATKKNLVASTHEEVVAVDGVHQQRVRLMKYSLKVFAVLALLQLLVWGMLQANLFPEGILEILTG